MNMLNTYSTMAAFLGSKDKRAVPSVRSTVVVRVAADAVAVRYHGTDVVTAYGNGSFRLDSGGYATATTKARINDHSPARVSQRAFEWFVANAGQPVPFADGMLVNAGGAVILSIEPEPTDCPRNLRPGQPCGCPDCA